MDEQDLNCHHDAPGEVDEVSQPQKVLFVSRLPMGRSVYLDRAHWVLGEGSSLNCSSWIGLSHGWEVLFPVSLEGAWASLLVKVWGRLWLMMWLN